MIVVDALEYSYGATPALRGASLHVEQGEQLALMGPSGSGKSTLLHCVAGILRVPRGHVTIFGEDLGGLSDSARARLRLARMGLAFQLGELVSELTLLENVMLPLQLLGKSRGAEAQAMSMLDRLGVSDEAHRRAGAVSGGQAQRAAVARALVHEPPLVLADEPTGSLDTVNAEGVMSALVSAVRACGSTLVVVTHDHRVAAHLDRHVTMVDGRVLDPVPAA